MNDNFHFTVPGRLPGMNEIVAAASRSRYAYAKMKKNTTFFVSNCIRLNSARRDFPDKPIILGITWIEPNGKRDPDNVRAGIKFILDGMVAAGAITNDTQKYVKEITDNFCVDKKNPRIEVMVTYLDE